MDKGSKDTLTMVRLPQGGYVVMDGYRPEQYGQQLFACTTIDEALKFMRDLVLPVQAQMSPANRKASPVRKAA